MFQFYLSSIKREENSKIIDCGTKFQFYLSSIKSLDCIFLLFGPLSFNSTLVQLKESGNKPTIRYNKVSILP